MTLLDDVLARGRSLAGKDEQKLRNTAAGHQAAWLGMFLAVAELLGLEYPQHDNPLSSHRIEHPDQLELLVKHVQMTGSAFELDTDLPLILSLHGLVGELLLTANPQLAFV